MNISGYYLHRVNPLGNSVPPRYLIYLPDLPYLSPPPHSTMLGNVFHRLLSFLPLHYHRRRRRLSNNLSHSRWLGLTPPLYLPDLPYLSHIPYPTIFSWAPLAHTASSQREVSTAQLQYPPLPKAPFWEA